MRRWYVRAKGGEAVGPVDEELLLRGIRANKVPPDAEVMQEGSDDWNMLEFYEHFQDAIPMEDVPTRVVESPWFEAASSTSPGAIPEPPSGSGRSAPSAPGPSARAAPPPPARPTGARVPGPPPPASRGPAPPKPAPPAPSVPIGLVRPAAGRAPAPAPPSGPTLREASPPEDFADVDEDAMTRVARAPSEAAVPTLTPPRAAPLPASSLAPAPPPHLAVAPPPPSVAQPLPPMPPPPALPAATAPRSSATVNLVLFLLILLLAAAIGLVILLVVRRH